MQDAHKKYKVPRPTPSKGKGVAKGKRKPGNEAANAPLFTAKFSPIDQSGKSRLTVTDKRDDQNNRQWDVDVECLLCKKTIEEATLAPSKPTAQAADKQDEEEEAADGGNTPAPPAAPSGSTSPIKQAFQKLPVIIRKSFASTKTSLVEHNAGTPSGADAGGGEESDTTPSA